jgi:hypothetical protein
LDHVAGDEPPESLSPGRQPLGGATLAGRPHPSIPQLRLIQPSPVLSMILLSARSCCPMPSSIQIFNLNRPLHY